MQIAEYLASMLEQYTAMRTEVTIIRNFFTAMAAFNNFRHELCSRVVNDLFVQVWNLPGLF